MKHCFCLGKVILGGTSGLRKKAILFQEKFQYTLLSQVDLDFSHIQNYQDLEWFQLPLKIFVIHFISWEVPS